MAQFVPYLCHIFKVNWLRVCLNPFDLVYGTNMVVIIKSGYLDTLLNSSTPKFQRNKWYTYNENMILLLVILINNKIK